MTYRAEYVVRDLDRAAGRTTATQKRGSFTVDEPNAEAAVGRAKAVLDDALRAGQRLLNLAPTARWHLISVLPVEMPGPEWERVVDLCRRPRSAAAATVARRFDWREHDGVEVDAGELTRLAETAVDKVRVDGPHAQACVSVGNRLMFAREDYGALRVTDCLILRAAEVPK